MRLTEQGRPTLSVHGTILQTVSLESLRQAFGHGYSLNPSRHLTQNYDNSL